MPVGEFIAGYMIHVVGSLSSTMCNWNVNAVQQGLDSTELPRQIDYDSKLFMNKFRSPCCF